MNRRPTDSGYFTFDTADNKKAERSIRQVVVDRKNFYGPRSIDGAGLAELMYTIIKSCKKFEIDPAP